MKCLLLAVSSILIAVLVPDRLLAQPDTSTTYQDPDRRSARRRNPAIRGLRWRVRTDFKMTFGFQRPVAVGEGLAFYVNDEMVVAADPQTANRLWAAGHRLRATLLYHNHRVYVPDASGTVHAFDSRTGRRIWSTTLRMRDIVGLEAVRDTLFVNSYRDGLAAVSSKTGRVRWRVRKIGSTSTGPVAVVGDVVLAAFAESGAVTVVANDAFDLRTGEQMWRLSGEGRLLRVDGDRLYFQDVWLIPDQLDRLEIDLVDADTGRVIRSRTYTITSADPNVHARWRTVLLQDDSVFVDMKHSVYRLSLRDPFRAPIIYRAPGAPSAPPTFGGSIPAKDSMWVAGPHDGKLFFSDRRRLDAVSLVGGKILPYGGVTNRISRLEIIGNRIYVGQVDGWFTILDLRTRRSLLRADTGVRIFHAFFVLDEIVLVQAEDELLAFPAP